MQERGPAACMAEVAGGSPPERVQAKGEWDGRTEMAAANLQQTSGTGVGNGTSPRFKDREWTDETCHGNK
jgi:hypothetical protein